MSDYTNAPTLVQFPRHIGDGVTKEYSISPTTETDAAKLIVALDGVKQRGASHMNDPLSDYELQEIGGETYVVFSTTPEDGVAIDMVYLQFLTDVVNPMSNKKFSEFRESNRLPTGTDWVVGLQDGDNVKFRPQSLLTESLANIYGKVEVDDKDTATLEAATEYINSIVGSIQVPDATGANAVEQPSQVGDGVSVNFTSPSLQKGNATNFVVYLDGLRQKPDEDFIINDSGDVSFSEAPEVGVIVDIGYFEPHMVADEAKESIKAKYEANPDTNAYTDAEKSQVASIVDKVNSQTGKGLSTNDFTDPDKALVVGLPDALCAKVDVVPGKELSTNDLTDDLLIKLNNLSTPSDDYIFDAVLRKDGDASGLDADLLDGQEGSYYAVAGDLTNLQTLVDTKVDKAPGKSLTDNNYTNVDKALVDGLTASLGTKVDKDPDKELSTNDYTDADKAKLDSIVIGSSIVDWGDIGGTLANQTDLQAALDTKVQVQAGLGLSENSFTDADKAKLDNTDVYTKPEIDLKFDNKVDIETGKGLSANDFTNTDKAKLDSLGVTVALEEPTQTGDGSNKSFTSPCTYQAPVANFSVYLDGIRQKPGVDFSITSSGGVLFMQAPFNGTHVDVNFIE